MTTAETLDLIIAAAQIVFDRLGYVSVDPAVDTFRHGEVRLVGSASAASS